MSTLRTRASGDLGVTVVRVGRNGPRFTPQEMALPGILQLQEES